MKELSYKLFFKAFSNKTRLEIIKTLKKGSKNVTQLYEELGFEQSRVSHNLRCLEDCGFVNYKWNGKNRVYELDKKHILPIIKKIDKHLQVYEKRLKSCDIMKDEKLRIVKNKERLTV